MPPIDDFEINLNIKLNQMANDIAASRAKQEEMHQDISEIMKAVYHPDEGLYARLRELETWKSTSARLMWIMFTSFAGTIGALMLSKFG